MMDDTLIAELAEPAETKVTAPGHELPLATRQVTVSSETDNIWEELGENSRISHNETRQQSGTPVDSVSEGPFAFFERVREVVLGSSPDKTPFNDCVEDAEDLEAPYHPVSNGQQQGSFDNQCTDSYSREIFSGVQDVPGTESLLGGNRRVIVSHETNTNGALRSLNCIRNSVHVVGDGIVGAGVGLGIVSGDAVSSDEEDFIDTDKLTGSTTTRNIGNSTASGKEWAAVSNLDQFFQEMYKYYREKGFVCMVLTRLTNLASLAFTIAFSTFVFLFVNWSNLLKCHSESSCKTLEEYITFDSLTTMWNNPYASSHWEKIVAGYTVVFFIHWLWSFLSFFPTLKCAFEMKKFYRDKLGLRTRDLQTIPWSEVTKRLAQLQCNGVYIMQINKNDVNAHDVASRIMRKDNYLIALFNKNILDLSIPLPCPIRCVIEKLLGKLNTKMYLTRHNFIHNVDALKWRFILVAILNFILMPFILIFSVVYFFMRNAEEFHTKRDYLGPREWSPLARWKFREFNELPHVFELRLNRSYKAANDYEKLFPTPAITIMSRFISFIVGSLLGLLLFFTFLDEHILLQVNFMERNLFWYVAIFTGILAVARSFVPNIHTSNREDPAAVFYRLVNDTHYMPDRWRNKESSYDTRDDLLTMYRYKVVLFLMEVSSVVVAPFILLFSLPSCAEDICAFVRDYTVNIDGLGHVCGYSLFDFEKFGDEKYAGKKSRIDGEGNGVIGGTINNTDLIAKNGKMEKSFLSFVTQHPDWSPSLSHGGEDMLKSLSEFRESVILENISNNTNENAKQYSSSINYSAYTSNNGMNHSLSSNGIESAVWSPSQSLCLSSTIGGFDQSQVKSTMVTQSQYGWLERFYEAHIKTSNNDNSNNTVVTSSSLLRHGCLPKEQKTRFQRMRSGLARSSHNATSLRGKYIELQSRHNNT